MTPRKRGVFLTICRLNIDGNAPHLFYISKKFVTLLHKHKVGDDLCRRLTVIRTDKYATLGVGMFLITPTPDAYVKLLLWIFGYIAGSHILYAQVAVDYAVSIGAIGQVPEYCLVRFADFYAAARIVIILI